MHSLTDLPTSQPINSLPNYLETICHDKVIFVGEQNTELRLILIIVWYAACGSMLLAPSHVVGLRAAQ